jgi:hypothetical protein
MAMIEIDIDDYVSEEEKKQLCIEYVRETIRGSTTNRERILSNMAYSAAFNIIDSALTPEMMQTIKDKVFQITSDPSSFNIFRKKDAWGSEDSEAYLEVKKAVSEHKHLIAPLVKQAILDKDYLKDLPEFASELGETLINALIKGLKERE